MNTPSQTIREILKVYADPESWEIVSRSSSEWDEYHWQGDDGKVHAWESAEDALAALDELVALHSEEQRRSAARLTTALEGGGSS